MQKISGFCGVEFQQRIDSHTLYELPVQLILEYATSVQRDVLTPYEKPLNFSHVQNYR